MKIGILQTDSVRSELIGQYGNYPDMFQNLFHHVDPSIGFVTYDVQHGHFPPTMDDCDAYITTGSKDSVYDNKPWIKSLGDFIATLKHHNKKLIAVCFGHQLVADIFGGKTEKSSKGWGVGVHTSLVHIDKKWMKPRKNEFNIVVSHQDQVTQLPDGAELIAGNDFCRHGMYQLGNNILAIQGHPEFSKDYAKTMMIHRADKIGAITFNKGMDSLKKPVDDLMIAKWFIEFLNF